MCASEWICFLIIDHHLVVIRECNQSSAWSINTSETFDPGPGAEMETLWITDDVGSKVGH